ncbi:MAG: TetR family transcriptional regulator [Mycobacteriales bacterium]
MSPTYPAEGKREAHKRATRQALQAAADRLFQERGYDGTTVRDIAAAAGVTERTFFRYFDGKEALVATEALSWLDTLCDGIRNRPAAEPALDAIQHAVLDLEAAMRASDEPSILTLYRDSLPAHRAVRAASAWSPARLLAIERALALAIRDRLAATDPEPAADLGYRADVLARVTLAAVRSALIEDFQLRAAGTADRPPLATLLTRAFAALTGSRG